MSRASPHLSRVREEGLSIEHEIRSRHLRARRKRRKFCINEIAQRCTPPIGADQKFMRARQRQQKPEGEINHYRPVMMRVYILLSPRSVGSAVPHGCAQYPCSAEQLYASASSADRTKGKTEVAPKHDLIAASPAVTAAR